MDENVQGNTHGMAARGRATSFLLPWQDLLQQLHDGEAMEALGKSISLLQKGKELIHLVSTLLKTSSRDDTEINIVRFIH